jgi:carbon dioxide concentrating mechanism protein CcmN
MVHPTANVATGVMLHADAGSQLVIGAGACIGWGCVLHAHSSTLVIGTGVILGMGTLVIGNSQVGDHACIGAATSIIDSTIAARAIVPPNSLINAGVSTNPALSDTEPATPQLPTTEPPVESPLVDVPVTPPPSAPESVALTPPVNAPIYGKKSLERLLATLRNEKPDLE